MGQETTSLIRYGSPKERVIELSMAIRERRHRLGAILDEMDLRRRDLFDIKRQLRENAVPLVLLAAGIGGLVALGLNLRSRRIHNERRLVSRLRRARHAIGRAMKEPDRVAAPPPDVGKKLLIAIASAAATTLVTVVVKRIAEEVVVSPARTGGRTIARALPTRRMSPRPVGVRVRDEEGAVVRY